MFLKVIRKSPIFTTSVKQVGLPLEVSDDKPMVLKILKSIYRN